MIESVHKWSGSVEDGIEFVRSFRQVHIHTRCMEVASEFVKYSYKTDRVTGDILPQIVDKDNHYIDALRYALQPMIKKKGKPRISKVVGF
jgi:phage terminase large subunit